MLQTKTPWKLSPRLTQWPNVWIHPQNGPRSPARPAKHLQTDHVLGSHFIEWLHIATCLGRTEALVTEGPSISCGKNQNLLGLLVHLPLYGVLWSTINFHDHVPGRISNPNTPERAMGSWPLWNYAEGGTMRMHLCLCVCVHSRMRACVLHACVGVCMPACVRAFVPVCLMVYCMIMHIHCAYIYMDTYIDIGLHQLLYLFNQCTGHMI